MDVEIRKVMDGIIEKMHQINWWMMELQKLEMEGKKITKSQVINNKSINRLFGQVQYLYRLLQELIEKQMNNGQMHFYDDIDSEIEYMIGPEDDTSYIINELKDYICKAHTDLKYITLIDKDGNIVSKGIYYDTPYEQLMTNEHNIQILNLVRMQTRIESQKDPDNYSFDDKREILEYISDKKFFNNYPFDVINGFIREKKANKENMSKELYDFELQQLYQQKYMYYLYYLNSKYNGFIQENDIGKFEKAKRYIEDGAEKVILGMSDFEIDANLKINIESRKSDFKDNMNYMLKNCANRDRKEIEKSDEVQTFMEQLNIEEPNREQQNLEQLSIEQPTISYEMDEKMVQKLVGIYLNVLEKNIEEITNMGIVEESAIQPSEKQETDKKEKSASKDKNNKESKNKKKLPIKEQKDDEER